MIGMLTLFIDLFTSHRHWGGGDTCIALHSIELQQRGDAKKIIGLSTLPINTVHRCSCPPTHPLNDGFCSMLMVEPLKESKGRARQPSFKRDSSFIEDAANDKKSPSKDVVVEIQRSSSKYDLKNVDTHDIFNSDGGNDTLSQVHLMARQLLSPTGAEERNRVGVSMYDTSISSEEERRRVIMSLWKSEPFQVQLFSAGSVDAYSGPFGAMDTRSAQGRDVIRQHGYNPTTA
jgi:hypothetical protein